MLVQEVRKMAKEKGVAVGKKNKGELIRSIQLVEGNFDCFGSAINGCDQTECVWMDDCLGVKVAKKK